MFRLFYQEGVKTKDDIIDDISNAVVYTTDLAAPDETKGVIQIAPNTTHPFVITDLKSDIQYSFFLRIIHPDTPAGTPVGTKANERTEYAHDTAVVQGTSAPDKYWYVSNLLATSDFENLTEITVAPDGTLYVADSNPEYIKKLTIAGDGKVTVSTIAGDGTADYKDHETIGTLAQFKFPTGMAVVDDALYVADTFNDLIRKITLSGTFPVSTIAGETGNTKIFNNPYGIAAASSTVLYVADTQNNRIRKLILKEGGTFKSLSTIANDFKWPYGIAVAPDGKSLYVADSGNNLIKKLAIPGYAVKTIAGKDDGFSFPQGIAVAPDGKSLYVADTRNNRIRKITLSGTYAVSTIAGSGSIGTTNGIGIEAQFNKPYGIAAASNTVLYVADSGSNRIRKLEYKAKDK